MEHVFSLRKCIEWWNMYLGYTNLLSGESCT